jgi:glycolate dehydrogenase FAD-binding subunit
MQLHVLQSALAEAAGHRQKLMLDPPAGGTLGGIVATAASGPLRSRYGTPRDLVIGVRFVLADGTVGHAGGKVVKNVAGYDIAKLLTGSLGTLGLITQVAFRLHPDPPSSRTIVFNGDTAAGIVGFLESLRSVPVAVTCADVLWPDAVVRVRIDGSSDAVEQQAQRVTASAGGRIVDDAESTMLDSRVAVRPWNGEGAVAGVAVPRARIGELIDIASQHTEEMVLRGLIGTGEARLDEDATLVTRFRAAVAALDGHVVLHRSPPSMGAVTWPPGDAVAVDLMRSVKSALDPAGVLAPGRFLAGI